MHLIQPVDQAKINKMKFKSHYVSCIVLTKDHKILLQHRGDDWSSFPGFISTFGGKIENHETPYRALTRELKEELGAQVLTQDVTNLGSYTEAVTHHSECIHGYYWYDKHNTMTGCYEGEPRYFDHVNAVRHEPKVMDDVIWLLQRCCEKKLIK